jgi:DNA-directed RNA polymerase specialized sigma24 family protein
MRCLLRFGRRSSPFCRERTDADVAEDLSQQTVLRIDRAIGRTDPERADSYLSAVARNLLQTNYRVRARDRQRTTSLDANIEIAVESRSTARAEYEDLVTAVHRACLRILQPALREVALGVLRGDSAAVRSLNFVAVFL